MIYSPEFIYKNFCHRTDAYAYMTRHPWQVNRHKGETELRENYYDRVYEPITLDLIAQHLMGRKTIAVFPTRIEDQTVKFMCWDIDEPDPALFVRVLNYAKHVQSNFKNSRIIIEASGEVGHHHIWLLLNDIYPLSEVRNYMYDRRLEGIDSFPNQDVVINDYYFELPIKLPCGYHRGSKKFSQFVDESLNVIQLTE